MFFKVVKLIGCIAAGVSGICTAITASKNSLEAAKDITTDVEDKEA